MKKPVNAPDFEEKKDEEKKDEQKKLPFQKAAPAAPEGSPEAPGAEEKPEKEEEETEEEEKACKKGCKKSVDLTGEDLEKSLEKLETLVQASDTTSRKDSLLSKAQKGEELSKSERSELFGLLGGETPKESTVAETVTKGLKENETLQKALDVSDFLTEQHTELCKSLTSLGETVQKSDSRQHEFNLVLAKAVADVGNLVKAVAENIGAIAAQPAHAPKSVGVAGGKVLQKGFGGEAPAEDSLSKAEVLNTLESMLEKSQGGISQGGEDLLVAIAKYEQMNRMSPSLLAEVKAFRGSVTH